MKRILVRLFLLGSIFITGLIAVQPALAATDPLDQACSGAGASSTICQSKTTPACAGHNSNNPACQNDNPISGKNGVLTRTISLVSYIAGIAAIIVLMVGGIMYVTSGGDSGKTATGRDMIIYALVGLVIIVLARSIVVFIINRV